MQSEIEKGNYWTNLLEKMVDKFEILRTRSGRAGLVHNYMRGLEVKLLTNSGLCAWFNYILKVLLKGTSAVP